MDRNRRLLYGEKDLKFLLGIIEVNIITINYEPPVPLRYFRMHSHSSYELHYIPQGRGWVRVNHKEYEIVPGTFYLSGPGILHEQLADENDPMCEYCLNFEFRKLGTRGIHNQYCNKNEIERMLEVLGNTNFWFGQDEYSTFELFERVFSEIETKQMGYYTSILNLASQIIINSIRNFGVKRDAAYDIPDKISYDKRRNTIDNFFREYDKSLKPGKLSKLLNVSERQLNRIMHQYFCMSFKEMLIHTRIEVAKEMLKDTGMTVKDIAANVGFTTAGNFYKAFTKATGVGPGEYRVQQGIVTR